jgi:hypothetical protein
MTSPPRRNAPSSGEFPPAGPPDGYPDQWFHFASYDIRKKIAVVNDPERMMKNFPRRRIFMGALRSGLLLLGGVMLSAAQEIPTGGPLPAPDPSQGSVDRSGKFMSARLPEESLKTPTTPEEWKDAASELIQITGEQTFRVGLVQGDRATRTLTLPAEVNTHEGLIEYALVTRKGKLHEALLSTAADPLHLQMAALLLGMSPQPGQQQAYEVTIEVEWESNGPTRKMALEELIALAKDTPQGASGGTLARGPWKFTGSLIDTHGFVAAREGSLIALIEDPAALVANPRPGRENDRMHVPNGPAMPGVGMPVSVRIRLSQTLPQNGESPNNP